MTPTIRLLASLLIIVCQPDREADFFMNTSKLDFETLYRFYDSKGQLLYVGISQSWVERLRQHHRNSEWFDQVASASFEHFSSRDEVEKAEKKAIQTEGAIYNKALNPHYENPKNHFQKIKRWVYDGGDLDENHQAMVDELRKIFFSDSYWTKRSAYDLAYWLIISLPKYCPDCESCVEVFHNGEINNWFKIVRERRNAIN